MRKAGSGLGLAAAAGIGGVALAASAATPASAILLGLCLAGGVVVFIRTRTDDLGLFAVALLVVTITWNGIRLGGGGSTSAASGGALGDATMVIAALGVIAYAVGDRRPVPLPPWLLVAGIGCLLAAVLVIVFPPSIRLINLSNVTGATLAQQSGITGPIGALGQAGDTITLIEYELALVVIPVLIATVATTPRRCRLLLDLWVAGAVINGAVGVLSYAGIPIAPVPSYQHRSSGLTIQPNYLALTCVIALPMAMLWFGRSRRWTIAGWIAVLGLLGGVFSSGSRAGAGGAVIALVATVTLVPRLRPRLAYVLPVAGMAAVAVLTLTSTGRQLLHQLRLGGGTTTVSGSNYQRSLVASVAWTQVRARPLEGVGWYVITNAHDIYLELLDAAGAIGLASFLVFLGGMGSSLRRALRGPLHDEAVACAVAILAWLANGVFDNQLADKYLYVVPGLLLAIGRTSWLVRQREIAAVAESAVLRGPAVAYRAPRGVRVGVR